MGMRVCHVTSVHPADDVRIFQRECLSLAKRYEVYLIAPQVEDCIKKGVHIVGVSLPQGRLKRLLCLNRVLHKALEVDADIYHLHDPELMALGLKLKRQGKRVVFDSHEDVPMQILTKEYLPKWSRGIVKRVYEWMERPRLRRYDALVTVTPTIVERLQRINSKCAMVTNYPVYHDTPHVWQEREVKYVCFAGGVDERYMHEYIIESLRYTRAHYLLAGKSFFPAYMQRLQNMEMWNKVDYAGVLPPERVHEIYDKADIGLVLLDY